MYIDTQKYIWHLLPKCCDHVRNLMILLRTPGTSHLHCSDFCTYNSQSQMVSSIKTRH